jgi:hypothetical protein
MELNTCCCGTPATPSICPEKIVRTGTFAVRCWFKAGSCTKFYLGWVETVIRESTGLGSSRTFDVSLPARTINQTATNGVAVPTCPGSYQRVLPTTCEEGDLNQIITECWDSNPDTNPGAVLLDRLIKRQVFFHLVTRDQIVFLLDGLAASWDINGGIWTANNVLYNQTTGAIQGGTDGVMTTWNTLCRATTTQPNGYPNQFKCTFDGSTIDPFYIQGPVPPAPIFPVDRQVDYGLSIEFHSGAQVPIEGLTCWNQGWFECVIIGSRQRLSADYRVREYDITARGGQFSDCPPNPADMCNVIACFQTRDEVRHDGLDGTGARRLAISNRVRAENHFGFINCQ